MKKHKTPVKLALRDEDANVLRYCVGGHQYVGICDCEPEPELSRGSRFSYVETDSLSHAWKSATPRMTGVVVYRRVVGGWESAGEPLKGGDA